MTSLASPPAVVSATQAALVQMLYGAQTSQAIYVAAKLGIADLLQQAPRDVTQIAADTGVDPAVLRRLLNFLVSRQLFAQRDDGLYELTASGQLLRSDHVDSVHQRALFNAEVLYPLWGELLHSVRSGRSAAVKAFGKPLYEHLAEQPGARELFDRTMASAARFRHLPAVAACDFSRFGTLVDIGGGNGALLIAILQAYPGPQGIVFDHPPAIARARQAIESAGLGDRCSVIAGNALEAVPAGGDAYILSNFLLEFDDIQARTILGHCRSAMAGKGTLVVIEWLMPTGEDTPDPYRFWDTASMDLIMLAIGGSEGGRVRTAPEFRALLESAGFELQRILATGAAIRVLEACPTE